MYATNEKATSLVVSDGVTASLVRSTPYTTHGCRPTSAVYQPVRIAMKTVGNDRKVADKNHRVVARRPRHRNTLPNHDTASMISPIPTIRRNAKKGIT